MSGFIPSRPSGESGSTEGLTLYDPRRNRAWVRGRWELRSAQWRAVLLAHEIFGDAEPLDTSFIDPDSPFRGVVELGVPFRSLEEHRELEAEFTAAAEADPVLARVPLVYVFSAGVSGGPGLPPAGGCAAGPAEGHPDTVRAGR